MLSGNVWTGISINLDLDGVTAELLIAHGDGSDACTEVSLAKFEFITSRLSFDSFSDGSKDIDLVSHAIKVLDTRYRGQFEVIWRLKVIARGNSKVILKEKVIARGNLEVILKEKLIAMG